MVPLNWKIKMPPGQLGLLMPVNQHAQKEQITLIMKGELDDAMQQKTREHIWNGGNTTGHLSMLSCPVMSQWELQQSNISMTRNVTDHSEIKSCSNKKVWVT